MEALIVARCTWHCATTHANGYIDVLLWNHCEDSTKFVAHLAHVAWGQNRCQWEAAIDSSAQQMLQSHMSAVTLIRVEDVIGGMQGCICAHCLYPKC